MFLALLVFLAFQFWLLARCFKANLQCAFCLFPFSSFCVHFIEIGEMKVNELSEQKARNKKQIVHCRLAFRMCIFGHVFV